MKRNIIGLTLLFIIISGLPFSCKTGNTELEREHIESVLGNLNVSEGIKWVVVLPGLGCHGCIQEGEAFLREHIVNEKIFLVLTNIESLKILQNKLGIEVDMSCSVYVDWDDEFLLSTENMVYPCIIHLKNGRYESHEFQAPGNNAFEKLATLIFTE